MKGYTDSDGTPKPGYREMVQELLENFHFPNRRLSGRKGQKAFISLFGAILRMREYPWFLSTNFSGNESCQNGNCKIIWDGIRSSGRMEKTAGKRGKENINDDIVFEIELIKQIEINIDYILMLVKNTTTPIVRTKRYWFRFAGRLTPVRAS